MGLKTVAKNWLQTAQKGAFGYTVATIFFKTCRTQKSVHLQDFLGDLNRVKKTQIECPGVEWE